VNAHRKDNKTLSVPDRDDQNDPATGYVIIIAGETDSPEQRQLRQKLTNASQAAGLKVLKTIRISTHRVLSGADNGRSLPLVAPEDARWMYTEFHRYDVAVLALRSAHVRRDPSMDPARERKLLTLERFVRYKAYYGTVRTLGDINAHLREFDLLRRVIGCDGVDDPRALPHHIFNCEYEWTGLASAEEQRRFVLEHGPSNRRRDCSGMNWQKPKGQAARHGGPALRIARRTLEQGFHWDVSGRIKQKVFTADAVWVLKQGNSYLNIYPNGHIRPPGRGYGTVRIWPK
jgi:hypothetical protein